MVQQLPHPAAAAPPPASTRAARDWLRWWRRLSPSRQDRIVMLIPLVAVLLFLVAIIAAFWYLSNQERLRELSGTRLDAESSQQQLRLNLINNEDALQRFGQEVVRNRYAGDRFEDAAEALLADHPELLAVSWHDLHSGAHLHYSRPDGRPENSIAPGPPPAPASGATAAELQRARYGHPHLEPGGVAVMHVDVPLFENTGQRGTVSAVYGLDRLLRYQVPPEITAHATVWLQDADGQVLASTNPLHGQPEAARPKNPAIGVPVRPVGHVLMVYARGYRVSQTLVGGAMFWFVAILSGLTATMLLLNWLHTRQRLRTQAALEAETSFRRAMENSLVTGMRVLDLDGRITYVNPAFCRMLGLEEHELVGQRPPFSYWPEHVHGELRETLDREMSGNIVPGGFEVRLRRKSGQEFAARLYVSPLIDARGRQTGWMTAITDISEAKRIREELAAAGERFTTVLEGLDSSVSVVALGSQELLFANRSYRQFFGDSAHGHLVLAGEALQAQSLCVIEPVPDDDAIDDYVGLPREELLGNSREHHEVYAPDIDRWLEVRSRYLPWVDGRLAQMIIATDITERHRAEEQAAIQAEKAQEASRLITMGEMASSVAHELNQPLTAISNYCMGMISRVRAGSVDQQALLGALDKTARQAQRAGQIIQRIRAFVKKSAPNRTLSAVDDILADVLELAEIEVRRHNVRLTSYVAQRLPRLLVDPILIEQVLLNLIRNAAESIDQAERPADRRTIELRVNRAETMGPLRHVEFSVTDSGSGLAPETLKRLFEAFYTTKAGGLGIGLNLCRSIVESHQGRMTVENLYNGREMVGCRFSFTLPVPETTPEALHDSDEANGLTRT